MKQLSILIGCYGEYPHYSLRAVESVLSQDYLHEIADLHVGLTACCEETTHRVWEYYCDGDIDTVLATRTNVNKDPMMRLLIERSRTPYVCWMDDDSWMHPGALQMLNDFVIENQPFDGAGKIYYMRRGQAYMKFLVNRPWYQGTKIVTADSNSNFPTGGLFLSRTDFLRNNDFPDLKMVKRGDDVLFGDLLLMQNGKMIPFNDKLLALLAISDGDRRGGGEEAHLWNVTDAVVE